MGGASGAGWNNSASIPATNAPVQGPIRLEPAPNVMVLVRLQDERDSTRAIVLGRLPGRCGRPAALLAGRRERRAERRVSQDARDRRRSRATNPRARYRRWRSIATPAASAAILDLAKNGVPRLRQRALFWIARRAESQAAGIITQAIDNDPDVEVKRQAVSALSQLPRDEGIPLLIKLARSHTNPVVRKQAMQRLGQSNDPRALSFFEEVLR